MTGLSGTPIASVDETGLHVPDFPTIFTWFQSAYRGVYGDDTYLEPDGQDGQWLGILASLVNDLNAMAAQVYNSFSPATAQGAGLSSVVKINGIARKVPSRSTCDLLLGGQAGTQIINGVVQDNAGVRWNLPPLVVIPFSGQIVATATAAIIGAITAKVGQISNIVNTQPGWQTAVNNLDATPGLPVETDAQLRQRQALSTSISALGLLDALVGALWTISDVRQLVLYENDTSAPDAKGIPGHCYALVVDGGDADAIATMLAEKKGGGVGTFGNEVFTRVNQWGISRKIAFSRPVQVPITWIVTLDTFDRYTMNTELAIAQSLSDWTNALGIGANIRRLRALVPVNLGGGAGSETFEPLIVQVARDGNAPGESDITIAFNEQPTCAPQFVQFRYPDAP